MLLRIISISALLLGAGDVSAVEYRYDVNLDKGLSAMRVMARFSEPVYRIGARDRAAERYIVNARDCETGETLGLRGRRLVLPAGGIRCLDYEVRLAQAAADDRRSAVLSGDNVALSPSVWLWRPKLGDGRSIDIGFNDGIRVSVPWPRNGEGRYTLSESPGSGNAITVFGNFEKVERRVGDTHLRIAMLRTNRDYDYAAIADWVQSTAENVLLAYGRFPYPEPQVIVVPVGGSGWGGDKAVPFGRVLRDGGETVELFINQYADMDDFYGDWIATHEFSHLMLPYVTIRQRWVSEGFAAYYQNVLLGRAGIYDEQTAWQKLYEGLERGRRSRPELSPNGASRDGIRRALMKVYWSGAAIALKADVELRRRSGGEQTLDSVLADLEQCCLPSERVWQASELFSQLDSLLDEPLFMPLYERYADTPGFPAYNSLLAELGVIIRNDRVSLSNATPLAYLRQDIIAVDDDVASASP